MGCKPSKTRVGDSNVSNDMKNIHTIHTTQSNDIGSRCEPSMLSSTMKNPELYHEFVNKADIFIKHFQNIENQIMNDELGDDLSKHQRLANLEDEIYKPLIDMWPKNFIYYCTIRIILGGIKFRIYTFLKIYSIYEVYILPYNSPEIIQQYKNKQLQQYIQRIIDEMQEMKKLISDMLFETNIQL